MPRKNVWYGCQSEKILIKNRLSNSWSPLPNLFSFFLLRRGLVLVEVGMFLPLKFNDPKLVKNIEELVLGLRSRINQRPRASYKKLTS